VDRVCFTLQVRDELIDEYRERHAAVWPEMLDEIKQSGRSNYSIYLRDDGLLVGYYEAESDEQSTRYLQNSSVAARWEAEMQHYFVGATERVDQATPPLTEIFNLTEALHK
jgi:L-rhamnose mutarotase